MNSRSRDELRDNVSAGIGLCHPGVAGGATGVGSDPDLPGRLAPRIRALVAALDAIDGTGSGSDHDPPSQALGSGGLGAEQVSEADIEVLARLHHRLTAQIGRLVRGPVATTPDPVDASSLVPTDPPSDPPSDPVSGAGEPASSGPDPGQGSPDPDGGVDGARNSLPFGAQNTLLRCGWRPGQARTVIAAARFAARYPELEQLWRTGVLSAEAVFLLRHTCRKLDSEQEASFMAVMLEYLSELTYSQLRRLTRRVLDLVLPDDIDDEDQNAHASRSLSFSVYGDIVMFQGQLPKLEGKAFQDTITAIVEQQRAQGDLLTPGQRNADALTELVVNSSLAGDTPSLGGLPVAVTLTLSLDQAEDVARGGRGDADADPSGSRGESDRATYPDGDIAGSAATRFALCCAEVTPITCSDLSHDSSDAVAGANVGQSAVSVPGSLRDRLLRAPKLPLSVGRAQRLATPAQRKALAVRDGGCVIPGCEVPPNRTQPHHVIDYSFGGPTDLDNLASLCWVHHRQVDLHLWRLTRGTRGSGSEPDRAPASGPGPGSKPDSGTSSSRQSEPVPYWTVERLLVGRH